MDILTGSNMKAVMPLYDTYDSNQAVIYSVLEGQFDGCVYTDGKIAILRTPFQQHFIAGVPDDSCEAVIDEILFNSILNGETELVVFADSDRWSALLNRIFTRRKGVSDGRKIFAFNRENYMKIKRCPVSSETEIVVELRKCLPFSHKDTWSVRLFIESQEVSHCDAIMVGKGMAEIDIGTDERYRGKGFATQAATILIDKLLEYNMTPTWSTWPYRVESQHIAQKLGFIPMSDAKAWIWTKND